jgi:hypothetical protein
MARKFLYVIAGITVLVIAGLFLLRIFAADLTEYAFVPSAEFDEPPAATRPDYAEAKYWISRPGLEPQIARWNPEGGDASQSGTQPETQTETQPGVVFFVHPTSYISRDAWNGPISDPTSRGRAELYVRGMASPFGQAGQIWAPRYRQATVGAFLTDDVRAMMALDLAYADVLAAFDAFVEDAPPGEPIVLAGHSQGAFILRRLIRDRVAGKPIAERILAAYIVGWPVSVEHDLPVMGLPACEAADDTGCILSWLTFADPADTGMLRDAYSSKPGLDGEPVGDSPFLCINPLTGTRDGIAQAADNLGTLVPDLESTPMKAELIAGQVAAQCGQDNLLHIGEPPDLGLGPYVLPGNNYHLYDITLFWANLRADYLRRLKAWQAAQTPR